MINIIENDVYRFCATRWIEDEDVAHHAIKLWPTIVNVVKHRESLCKSKRPKNKSYDTLVACYKDPLVPIRLQSFKDIANQLKGYLERFKTNKSMVPFLADALQRY